VALQPRNGQFGRIESANEQEGDTMNDAVRIALVGDYDPSVIAHQTIPNALALAAREVGVAVDAQWVGTETIVSDDDLAGFDGIWCVPASPYRSVNGALRAIRFARETPLPFFGTCGGFQHAVMEYAQSVLGWTTASHAEIDVDAEDPLIAPLSCALVEANGEIVLVPETRAAALYAADRAIEGYHCSYGINPRFADRLASGPLRVTGTDPAGDIRIVELVGHPFFVATLFQPERSALKGDSHPLIVEFVRAAAGRPGRPGRTTDFIRSEVTRSV
jgi:CTP synthase (UTP-ammonia lyase)